MDYCFANFLLATIFALTLGQIGTATDPLHPNFATQIKEDNGPAGRHCILSAGSQCLSIFRPEDALLTWLLCPVQLALPLLGASSFASATC